ncbi:shikimate dehydrogenase [Deinococcus wulumuqiensis]|uniref:shikimate dehydrogenase n=1 Tax=Deinococcus wulumuqiensis TaxID=980427 RepID=UPI003B96B306
MTVPAPAAPAPLSGPRRAFLYADPAAHSLSPRMHRAAFAWAGLSGSYEAERVSPAELPAALARLRTPSVLGANLSLPHKETALPLLDRLSDAARTIGAVNTVIHRDGELHGDNTDAPGLLRALEDAGLTAHLGAADRVVVLGAGGAARAATYAAVALGLEVWVVNRTPARARALAASWQGGGQVRAAELDEVPWAQVGLVINSSSAGLDRPDETPLPDFDFGRLPSRAGVYDMVYQPRRTRLLRDAQAAGLPAENGLGMLAHQARLAFAAWTGADVPVSVFLKALNSPDAPDAAQRPGPESA